MSDHITFATEITRHDMTDQRPDHDMREQMTQTFLKGPGHGVSKYHQFGVRMLEKETHDSEQICSDLGSKMLLYWDKLDEQSLTDLLTMESTSLGDNMALFPMAIVREN